MTSDARKRQAGESQVVTIDLGDVHQVRRLDDLIQKHLDDPSAPKYLSTADLLSMALSDFANPPKPDEPTETFARIEDKDGCVWCRMPEGGWKCETGAFVAFYELLPGVTRVLSDGVQP